MIWILWIYLIIANAGFLGISLVIFIVEDTRRDWSTYFAAWILCLIWPVSLVMAIKGGVV